MLRPPLSVHISVMCVCVCVCNNPTWPLDVATAQHEKPSEFLTNLDSTDSLVIHKELVMMIVRGEHHPLAVMKRWLGV